jgi:hypothetical protein
MSEGIILDDIQKYVPELNNKINDRLDNKTMWEEFKDFWNELINLLYTDLKNSYIFLTENKNYFFYAVLLAILLQFTSVSNLGKSFNKYCNKIIVNQNGGYGEIPSTNISKPQLEIQQYSDYKEDKKQKKKEEKHMREIEKQLKKEKQFTNDILAKAKKKGLTEEQTQEYLNKKKSEKQQNKNKLDLSIAKKSSMSKYNSEMKEKKLQDNESKANLKRISFFENIKNKFGKGSKWGGQYGSLGPVFGNMEKIFDSVKTVFYIITIILTIAGILSIPVLIFLIITYIVFKTMVSKFTAL